MIRKFFFLMLLAVPVFGSEPKVIPLWPGAAPGSENWNYEEGVPQDASHPITSVTHPTLTAYFPDPSLATGTAVIICPGGGFRELWVSHEGIDLARWLNPIGVAAFILKYRVMRTDDTDASNSAKMAERRQTVNHSIRLYAAWKKLGIPAELHIYSAGGHGFGTRLARRPRPSQATPELVPPWGVRTRVERPDASWHTNARFTRPFVGQVSLQY